MGRRKPRKGGPKSINIYRTAMKTDSSTSSSGECGTENLEYHLRDQTWDMSQGNCTCDQNICLLNSLKLPKRDDESINVGGEASKKPVSTAQHLRVLRTRGARQLRNSLPRHNTPSPDLSSTGAESDKSTESRAKLQKRSLASKRGYNLRPRKCTCMEGDEQTCQSNVVTEAAQNWAAMAGCSGTLTIKTEKSVSEIKAQETLCIKTEKNVEDGGPCCAEGKKSASVERPAQSLAFVKDPSKYMSQEEFLKNCDLVKAHSMVFVKQEVELDLECQIVSVECSMPVFPRLSPNTRSLISSIKRETSDSPRAKKALNYGLGVCNGEDSDNGSDSGMPEQSGKRSSIRGSLLCIALSSPLGQRVKKFTKADLVKPPVADIEHYCISIPDDDELRLRLRQKEPYPVKFKRRKNMVIDYSYTYKFNLAKRRWRVWRMHRPEESKPSPSLMERHQIKKCLVRLSRLDEKEVRLRTLRKKTILNREVTIDNDLSIMRMDVPEQLYDEIQKMQMTESGLPIKPVSDINSGAPVPGPSGISGVSSPSSGVREDLPKHRRPCPRSKRKQSVSRNDDSEEVIVESVLSSSEEEDEPVKRRRLAADDSQLESEDVQIISVTNISSSSIVIDLSDSEEQESCADLRPATSSDGMQLSTVVSQSSSCELKEASVCGAAAVQHEAEEPSVVTTVPALICPSTSVETTCTVTVSTADAHTGDSSSHSLPSVSPSVNTDNSSTSATIPPTPRNTEPTSDKDLQGGEQRSDLPALPVSGAEALPATPSTAQDVNSARVSQSWMVEAPSASGPQSSPCLSSTSTVQALADLRPSSGIPGVPETQRPALVQNTFPGTQPTEVTTPNVPLVPCGSSVPTLSLSTMVSAAQCVTVMSSPSCVQTVPTPIISPRPQPAPSDEAGAATGQAVSGQNELTSQGLACCSSDTHSVTVTAGEENTCLVSTSSVQSVSAVQGPVLATDSSRTCNTPVSPPPFPQVNAASLPLTSPSPTPIHGTAALSPTLNSTAGLQTIPSMQHVSCVSNPDAIQTVSRPTTFAPPLLPHSRSPQNTPQEPLMSLSSPTGGAQGTGAMQGIQGIAQPAVVPGAATSVEAPSPPQRSAVTPIPSQSGLVPHSPGMFGASDGVQRSVDQGSHTQNVVVEQGTAQNITGVLSSEQRPAAPQPLHTLVSQTSPFVQGNVHTSMTQNSQVVPDSHQAPLLQISPQVQGNVQTSLPQNSPYVPGNIQTSVPSNSSHMQGYVQTSLPQNLPYNVQTCVPQNASFMQGNVQAYVPPPNFALAQGSVPTSLPQNSFAQGNVPTSLHQNSFVQGNVQTSTFAQGNVQTCVPQNSLFVQGNAQIPVPQNSSFAQGSVQTSVPQNFPYGQGSVPTCVPQSPTFGPGNVQQSFPANSYAQGNVQTSVPQNSFAQGNVPQNSFAQGNMPQNPTFMPGNVQPPLPQISPFVQGRVQAPLPQNVASAQENAQAIMQQSSDFAQGSVSMPQNSSIIQGSVQMSVPQNSLYVPGNAQTSVPQSCYVPANVPTSDPQNSLYLQPHMLQNVPGSSQLSFSQNSPYKQGHVQTSVPQNSPYKEGNVPAFVPQNTAYAQGSDQFSVPQNSTYKQGNIQTFVPQNSPQLQDNSQMPAMQNSAHVQGGDQMFMPNSGFYPQSNIPASAPQNFSNVQSNVQQASVPQNFPYSAGSGQASVRQNSPQLQGNIQMSMPQNSPFVPGNLQTPMPQNPQQMQGNIQVPMPQNSQQMQGNIHTPVPPNSQQMQGNIQTFVPQNSQQMQGNVPQNSQQMQGNIQTTGPQNSQQMQGNIQTFVPQNSQQMQGNVPQNSQQMQGNVPQNSQQMQGNVQTPFPQNSQQTQGNIQAPVPQNSQMQGNIQSPVPQNSQQMQRNIQSPLPQNSQQMQGNIQTPVPQNSQQMQGNMQSSMPQNFPYMSGNEQSSGLPNTSYVPNNMQSFVPQNVANVQGNAQMSVPQNSQQVQSNAQMSSQPNSVFVPGNLPTCLPQNSQMQGNPQMSVPQVTSPAQGNVQTLVPQNPSYMQQGNPQSGAPHMFTCVQQGSVPTSQPQNSCAPGNGQTSSSQQPPYVQGTDPVNPSQPPPQSQLNNQTAVPQNVPCAQGSGFTQGSVQCVSPNSGYVQGTVASNMSQMSYNVQGGVQACVPQNALPTQSAPTVSQTLASQQGPGETPPVQTSAQSQNSAEMSPNNQSAVQVSSAETATQGGAMSVHAPPSQSIAEPQSAFTSSNPHTPSITPNNQNQTATVLGNISNTQNNPPVSVPNTQLNAVPLQNNPGSISDPQLNSAPLQNNPICVSNTPLTAMQVQSNPLDPPVNTSQAQNLPSTPVNAPQVQNSPASVSDTQCSSQLPNTNSSVACGFSVQSAAPMQTMAPSPSGGSVQNISTAAVAATTGQPGHTGEASQGADPSSVIMIDEESPEVLRQKLSVFNLIPNRTPSASPSKTPGTPTPGTPTPGTPTPGAMTPGTPIHGAMTPGTPTHGGMPGTPTHGGMMPGTPTHGGMMPGTPTHGGMMLGTPTHGGMPGTPTHGGMMPGTPTHGGMMPGTPTHGGMMPGTPTHGTPTHGTPTHGTPAPGTLTPGTPTPGTTTTESVHNVPSTPAGEDNDSQLRISAVYGAAELASMFELASSSLSVSTPSTQPAAVTADTQQAVASVGMVTEESGPQIQIGAIYGAAELSNTQLAASLGLERPRAPYVNMVPGAGVAPPRFQTPYNSGYRTRQPRYDYRMQQNFVNSNRQRFVRPQTYAAAPRAQRYNAVPRQQNFYRGRGAPYGGGPPVRYGRGAAATTPQGPQFPPQAGGDDDDCVEVICLDDD